MRPRRPLPRRNERERPSARCRRYATLPRGQRTYPSAPLSTTYGSVERNAMSKTISCNASMSWGFAAGIGILGAVLVACSGDDNGSSPSPDASSGSATGSTSGSGSSGSGSSGSSTTGSSTTGSSTSGSGSSTGSADGGTKGDATTMEASVEASTEAGSEAGTVEGNAVIADQYNNRVIEVDSHGNIVWTFGDGKAKPGPTSVVSPNDAERLANGQTLISGTGDPSGGAQGDTACAALDAGSGGCPDNRVLLVNADGGIAWQYGTMGELSGPVAAVMLASGNVLITDQGNNRIVRSEEHTS